MSVVDMSVLDMLELVVSVRSVVAEAVLDEVPDELSPFEAGVESSLGQPAKLSKIIVHVVRIASPIAFIVARGAERTPFVYDSGQHEKAPRRGCGRGSSARTYGLSWRRGPEHRSRPKHRVAPDTRGSRSRL